MSNIKLFESTGIRSVWNEVDSKWYFSVADVVQALTDSTDVRGYIKKMRKRESELNANWGTLCPPLELLAADGKRRQTQCANAEGLFRIIQSIPSPKAGRAVEGRRAATRVRCFRSISSAIGSRPIGGQGVRSDLQDS